MLQPTEAQRSQHVARHMRCKRRTNPPLTDSGGAAVCHQLTHQTWSHRALQRREHGLRQPGVSLSQESNQFAGRSWQPRGNLSGSRPELAGGAPKAPAGVNCCLSTPWVSTCKFFFAVTAVVLVFFGVSDEFPVDQGIQNPARMRFRRLRFDIVDEFLLCVDHAACG